MFTKQTIKFYIMLFMTIILPVALCAQNNKSTLEEAQKRLEKAQKELEKAQKEMAEAAKKTDNVKEVLKLDSATTEWTRPPSSKKAHETRKTLLLNDKINDDKKYLVGAIPTSHEGKVVFTLKLLIPNRTAQEIYNIVYNQLNLLADEENQFDESSIVLINPHKHVIAAKFKEWLLFSNNFLSLDRAILNYTIIAKCGDENLSMTLERISYEYEAGRPSGFKSTAEDIITDKEALNKKGNKLNRLTGKFRRKTIDRKDQLFDTIKVAFKNNDTNK